MLVFTKSIRPVFYFVISWFVCPRLFVVGAKAKLNHSRVCISIFFIYCDHADRVVLNLVT